MSAPILKTKLHTPAVNQNIISRPRLLQCLGSGVNNKFTLISAPAGFGKSTLVSSWAQQVGKCPRVSWLSLDEGDNDLTRFLTYFIAALQTTEPHIGQGALVALQSPGTVNIEVILTTLLNEMTELPGDVVLIMDDYHLIESRPIDQALAFLLEHLPAQMHLVIASRIDPSFPLSRLRARGQMTEIRADDLRFTPDEAAAFLNQVMGFELSADDVAALETRTEGWIAGLQLAALSMQGNHDLQGFVRSFTGSNRYILDYLGEEVLSHQPQYIQDFLLQTALDLLQKSGFSVKFKVVDGSNQIETEAKAFASIAIALTQDAKHLQAADDMLSKNALAGKFTISRFLFSCERMKL